MEKITNELASLFPESWLSQVQLTPDDFGESGFNVIHPNKPDKELSVVVTPELVGIAVLKKDEEELEIDFGGFDFTFSVKESSKLNRFFRRFAKDGECLQ